jgi:hypothetical protein
MFSISPAKITNLKKRKTKKEKLNPKLEKTNLII